MQPGEKLEKSAARFTLHRKFGRVYLSAVMALLASGAIAFSAVEFQKIQFPFGWDDDEGAVWWEAAHVTHLDSLYHPIQQYPYFVVPYPPVFHAITWLAEKVTGDFLIAGRLVCVFSAFGISLLLGLIVGQASKPRTAMGVRASAALLASLLCFRLDSLNIYVPEMGVDLPALFFAFLGVYLFLRSNRRPGILYAAFVCFVVAVFTKQTMVAAPLACLAATALVDWRKALRCFLFCLFLGGAALGLLAWATHGEILRHLFLYNAAQPISVIHWIRGMQANLIAMTPLAALALLALAPVLRRIAFGRWRDLAAWMQAGAGTNSYRRALVVLGFELCLALITSLSYGKAGSGLHYFLEWNFLCCALSGLILLRVLARWSRVAPATLGQVSVLVLLFLAALTGFPNSAESMASTFHFTHSASEDQATADADADVLQILQRTPGPVWCENMVLMMKAHKDIPIEPGIQEFLAKSGIWDESPFLAMISSQRFQVIILRDLNNGFYTDATVKAIEANYVLAEQIGNEGADHYIVFKPQQRGREN